MKRAGAASFVAVLPLALVASSAAAQTTGYAVNRFDPAEKGSDWFSNESLDLRGKVRPAIGVVGDYSTNEIAFKNYDGSKEGSVVGTQFFVHVGASLTLFDRLRLGLNVPFALYQSGQALAYAGGGAGATYNPPGKAAIGDVRVGADLRIFGEYKDAFTVAVGAQVHLPSGLQSQYTGDGSARIVPRLMIAGDIAEVAYAARIGYEVRENGEVYAGTQLGNEVMYGAAVGLRFAERHFLVGPEIYGATLASNAFKERTSPTEALFGVHYSWSDWRVGLGAGGGLADANSAPSFRLLAGLEWSPAIEEPKPADRDGDGVPDTEDACPDVPGLKTTDPKTNGCPAVVAPSDRDGDGIVDTDDACPDVPGVKTDDPKTNGCPPDKDGDGIADKDDACPDVPGVKTDDPKTNGCPPDKDGDGIADKDDACPDVPGVKTDDPKTNGCPADRDGDGIADKDDACPDQFGVKDPDPKKNGCPALAMIQNGMIKISEQVQFKTGSAQILAASDNLMNAVLGILKDHPEIKLVHIEGHTDNKGAAAMNKTLSDKRAKSVMAWLALKGVDKSRMDAKGYGPERPIDTNETDAGRQNNRRVEFHIDDSKSDAKPESKP